ncbi:MAG: hypothetical protein WDN00_10155 [Limisphaerales bacterium]
MKKTVLSIWRHLSCRFDAGAYRVSNSTGSTGDDAYSQAKTVKRCGSERSDERKEYSRAWLCLAMVGENQQARDCFARARQLSPEDSPTLLVIGWAYVNMNAPQRSTGGISSGGQIR